MNRFVDWFFRDRATGTVVIGQWPNLPLWLFGLAAGLSWTIEAAGLPAPASVVLGLRIASAVCLAWWALDEVIRGVNPWRRCLGGGVLLFGLWRLAGGL